MAYRFKKNEAIPHAIERVFAEEINWAVGKLVRSKDRGQAVHEARKSVKKIRGLLSLIALRLGACYKTEDRYFRDVGRLLSDLRDDAVMVQVFDTLAAKHPEMDVALRAEIRLNLQRCERGAPPEKEVSSAVVGLLKQARLQAKTWPLAELQFDSLLPVVTVGYRRCRKALKRAQKLDTAESFHDFRKKVKQHWYHLRLIDNVGDAHLENRLTDLRHLETKLGDEHNLSVLRARLIADTETTSDRHQARQYIAWLDDESHSLRKDALEAGHRLYAEKPAVFHGLLASLDKPVRKPVATSHLLAKAAVA